ncbi:hypothetical protein GJ496_002860 [Pomphorhynchus laevis]|nr:hypothetical protein GJ496_002860 [Pomphorhynchus laevis]
MATISNWRIQESNHDFIITGRMALGGQKSVNLILADGAAILTKLSPIYPYYLFCICCYSLLWLSIVSLRDPGILPNSYFDKSSADRDPTFTDNTVPTCVSCKGQSRPPGRDHHCQFTGTCIGDRNYSAFIIFIIVGAFASFTVVCLELQLIIGQICTVSSYFIAMVSLSEALYCSHLIGYHLMLLGHGLTTRTDVCRKRHKQCLPKFRLINYMKLFRSFTPSFMDRSHIV